jgi:alginate O-acetyltransferase complex protein AlgI
MQFCSQKFFLFFVLIFALYWALPWRRVRVGLLLAASFYFYASWNKSLALLICVSTLLDYLLALGIEYSANAWRRKLLVGASLFANLGLLCYFKYANFFLVSLDEALIAAGSPTWCRPMEVLLPVGISFYTFEAINYVVDVYRRRIPAERNLGDFMLFILFFPHLIAGPIVRARDFLPQIKRPKHWSWARMHLGTGYFLMGLVKKLAIADRMAEYVDPVFADPSAYRASAIVFAALAYAVQIYCDFSGYTDMAIGTAHLLGYKLARNFNLPYLAVNIADFWHRWHISLSSWLRDYLFIPLGGSRGTRWQTARNLLLTMTPAGRSCSGVRCMECS